MKIAIPTSFGAGWQGEGRNTSALLVFAISQIPFVLCIQLRRKIFCVIYFGFLWVWNLIIGVVVVVLVVVLVVVAIARRFCYMFLYREVVFVISRRNFDS